MQSTAASKSSLVLHKTVASIRKVRRALNPNITVGFVPTMGALHKGEEPPLKRAATSFWNLGGDTQEGDDIVHLPPPYEIFSILILKFLMKNDWSRTVSPFFQVTYHLWKLPEPKMT